MHVQRLVGELEADPRADDALLDPVVEVALDPLALGVRRLDQALARGGQLDHRGRQVGLETMVLVGDQRRRPRRTDEALLVGDGVTVDDHGLGERVSPARP